MGLSTTSQSRMTKAEILKVAPERVVTEDMHADVLRAAFSNVCNKDDWKAPINVLVPLRLVGLYQDAIEFMTGVKPTCWLTSDDSTIRLTCVGYRNGPCGDH
jgi:hypothetical protein